MVHDHMRLEEVRVRIMVGLIIGWFSRSDQS